MKGNIEHKIALSDLRDGERLRACYRGGRPLHLLLPNLHQP